MHVTYYNMRCTKSFTVNDVHLIAAYTCIYKEAEEQWETAGVMTGKSITEKDKHI